MMTNKVALPKKTFKLAILNVFIGNATLFVTFYIF